MIISAQDHLPFGVENSNPRRARTRSPVSGRAHRDMRMDRHLLATRPRIS